MNLEKLLSDDQSVVREYVRKKFKNLKGFGHTKSGQKNKCINYWLAVRWSEMAQEEIEVAYLEFFHDNFPIEEAERIETQRHESGQGMNPDEWRAIHSHKLEQVTSCLNDLLGWQTQQDYQDGPDFYMQVKQRTAFIDNALSDDAEFSSEFDSVIQAQLNTSVVHTDKEVAAKFDLLLGVKQTAECSFRVEDEDWGTLEGQIKEAFTAGLWANGGAGAALSSTGVSANVQAAIAIGLQLDLEGDLTLSKDDHAVKLGGKAKVFVGARANLDLKLSAEVREGLELRIKAGAFAGFEAEVKGYCSYSYEGEEIIKVEASAAVTFGAGAEFEASIKAPIFGPTEISFKANATLGFGTAVGTNVAVNFSELSLMASKNLQNFVEFRTIILKGYSPELMDQERRNKHYLNKAIRRMEKEMASTQSTLDTYDRIPEEKQSLLMHSGRAY